MPIKNKIAATLARIGIAGAAEGGQEIAENVGHDALRILATNPDAKIEFGQALQEGSVATVVGTIVRSVVEAALHIRTRGGHPAEQAVQAGEQLTQLGQLAAASKLRERDPAAFKAFIESVADEGQLPPEVFIDGQQLANVLAQSGIAVEEVEALIPGTKQQLTEALQTGGTVSMTAADFATHIAGTPLEQSILPLLKTAPAGMTYADAQVFLQGQVEAFQQEADKALADKANDTAFQTAVGQIEEEFTQQLMATGRYTPDVARAVAASIKSHYVVLGEHEKISPQEALQRHPLKVGAEPLQGPLFEQPKVGAGGTPQARVMFEVAPDPNNAELSARWNGISDQGKQQISIEVAQKIIPQVLARLGVPGEVKPQIGGYLDDTNPSFALLLPAGVDPALIVEVTRLTGFALSQDSMMTVSEQPFEGAEKVGALKIELPPNAGMAYVRGIYDRLRQIEINGERPISGHTTVDGQMAILNYSNVPVDELAKFVEQALNNEYTITVDDLYAWFPSKEDYNYASDRQSGETPVGQSPIQGDAHRLRGEASRAILDALNSGGYRQSSLDTGGAGAGRAAVRGDAETVGVRIGSGRLLGKADIGEVQARYGRPRDGSSPLLGVHYSKEPRTNLDGWHYGQGAEARRLENSDDPRIKQRIHFYVDEGHGIAPESEVGTHVHAINLDGMYNTVEDPKGLLKKVNTANSYWFNDLESAILDAGYGGIYVPGAQGNQGVAVLLGSHNGVRPEYKGQHTAAGMAAGPYVAPTTGKRAYALLSSEIRKFEAEQDAILAAAPSAQLKNGTLVFSDSETDAVAQFFPPAKNARLFQGDRGAFDPVARVITLLKDADLSTIHHELAHAFLENMLTVAESSPTMATELAKAFKWMGFEGTLADWGKLSIDEKRPFHEQFARGYEAFLFEGKAPSLELTPLFTRFRAWMMHIYRSLTKMGVELTDEMRGVYGRLLATEQQIKEAEAARSYVPLFADPEAAGMSPEQWREYQALGQQATEAAKTELEARSLRDMQWLSNAKSRKLKDLQAQAADKRKAVQREVEAEVNDQPIYAAQRFLKRGEVAGPKGESIQALEGHRLSIPALKEMYPEGALVALPDWTKLGYGKYGMLAEDGLHPDLVAEMFGFSSGDAMVRQILEAPPRREVIEVITDQRMLERYGDLSDPRAIERAAEAAIHNEARARFVAAELKALTKATGDTRIIVKAAKEAADAAIAAKRVRDLKVAPYTAAEAKTGKAADAAFRKGDLEAAAQAKRSQLLNNQLAKAADNAIEEVRKGVDYLKKFDREGTRKALDIDYLDQIDALLDRFDLRTGQSLKAIDKRKTLAEWIAAQEEQGFEPIISDQLREEANRKHYKDLKVEEFRGLVDAVKNIEHLARLKKKLLTLKDQREFAAVVEAVGTSIRENAKSVVPERRTSDRGPLVPLASLFRNFMADHRKFASLVREMDGWKDGGTAWDTLVRNMNDAGNFEAVQREKATIRLGELLAPILKTGKLGQKIYFPELGKSFTREERLGIALNMGNEVNRERVQSGERLSKYQLEKLLDTLTKEEWDFVQGVWDYLESYRSQIAAKERRLTGVEPEWVEPMPIQTKFGTYRGGYYPIKYDPLRSTKAEADMASEVQRQIERGLYTRSQTRRGHLKARTESTGRPLRYDLAVVVEHVDQVIHDLAWHEYLIDANRLLRAGMIDSAIREHYGPEKLRVMRDMLKDIAVGELGAQTAGDKVLNYLRHGATIAGLGWRVTTSLLQPLGLTQSIVRIGPQWVAKGAIHWMGDTAKLENSARIIGEKSDFMRLRAKTMQREISEIRNRVSGKDSRIEASYFYLIQKMQLVADIPTWWGAYEKAMAQSDMSEDRAVALADQAVIDAQGAGQIKDLAAVQRGSPAWKLFTNFYSFFNTTWNLTREATGRTDFKNPTSVMLLATDMVLLYTLPAILGTLMKAALSGDMEDEDELVRKLIADQMTYMLGTLVYVREASAAIQAAMGLPGSDYQGPASLRFFTEISKLAKQVEQGEADEPFWKSLNSAAGVLFHYPAGQINSTVSGIAAVNDGRTDNPGALLVGAPKR